MNKEDYFNFLDTITDVGEELMFPLDTKVYTYKPEGENLFVDNIGEKYNMDDFYTICRSRGTLPQNIHGEDNEVSLIKRMTDYLQNPSKYSDAERTNLYTNIKNYFDSVDTSTLDKENKTLIETMRKLYDSLCTGNN